MNPNCLQTLIAGRKSRERERERPREGGGDREGEGLVHAHPFGEISKQCIGGSTGRERCVFFLNFVIFFYTLGTRLHISKFCVDLCKKF